MNASPRVRRLFLSSFVELLLLLPAWLALDAWLRPAGAAWIPAAGIVLASFAGAAASLRWRRRWQQLAVAATAGAAAAGLLAGSAAPALIIAGAAVMAFAALQGVTAFERIDSPRWLWYGLALYFVAAVLYPRLDALRDTVPALTAGGAACLAIALFASNGAFLRGASLAAHGARPAPAALRQHNRALMAGVLVVAVALTAAFGNAFGKALYAVLRWLFGLLPNSAPAEQPPPPEPPPPKLPEGLPAAESEPGLLARVLEIVGYAIAALAAAALLVAIGVWVYRHAGGIIRTFLKRLAAFLTRPGRGTEDAAYVDEETVVFSWESVGKRVKESWLGRLLARSRSERWEDQRTNPDRVRYLYRRWLRSAVDAGYEHRSSLTPRETEADVAAWASGRGGAPASGGERALVELYDRVRYGGAAPSDADVERARRGIEGK